MTRLIYNQFFCIPILILLLLIIIIIIIIIIEFLTSQFRLGNIHLSWDVVINRIRLGGLICILKSFLQLTRANYNNNNNNNNYYYYYYYYIIIIIASEHKK